MEKQGTTGAYFCRNHLACIDKGFIERVFKKAESVTAWNQLEAAVSERCVVKVILDGDYRYLLGCEVGSKLTKTIGFGLGDKALRQVLMPFLF